MENEQRRGNTVLLTVIAVATLLVAVVGATFAYFSVTITGNEEASSIIIRTAQLGIVYDSGQTINSTGLMPGDTIPSKTFTVQNTGNISMTYKLVWIDVTNTFITKSDLKYSITSTASAGAEPGDTAGTPGTLSDTTAPDTGTNLDIVTGIVIPARATHSYTLTMTFANDTSSIQNDNQNKTFMGKINVVTSIVSNP